MVSLLTGILEVSGAIGLLVRKYRSWALFRLPLSWRANIVILHQPPLGLPLY